MSSFDKKFPSIAKLNFDYYDDSLFYAQDVQKIIMENCLDKNKVRKAIMRYTCDENECTKKLLKALGL